jgi:endonuclease YncB( thermonuclease family)
MIKKCFLFCIVFTICTTSLLFAESFTSRCLGVTDGDTVSVTYKGKEARVKLAGVECPEEGQDFCEEAKNFTSELLLDKDLCIDIKELDHFGRLEARVTVNDRDASLEVLRAGLGWCTKKYAGDRSFSQAESEAKEKKLGIWSKPDPVPPWTYRQYRSGIRVAPQNAESSSSTQPAASPDTWVITPGVGIGPVRLGGSVESIFQQLGKTEPMRLDEDHTSYSYDECGISIQVRYGTAIDVLGVFRDSSKGIRYITDRGISLGSSEQDVLKAYGTDFMKIPSQAFPGSEHTYYPQGIDFIYSKGRVAIILVVSPLKEK